MSLKTYRLGTRKSQLAQTQSTLIKNQLEALGLQIELVLIESSGDQDRSTPLYETSAQSPGIFVKQLEDSLLAGEIDLAVHSLKDVPTTQPNGLQVTAITIREAANDCLIARPDSLDANRPLGLKEGISLGTSSLRREAQVLAIDETLKVESLRGNLPTRVRAVKEGKVGATLLASAGLNRLQLEDSELVFNSLKVSKFIPAPGQGALAIETRKELDEALMQALAELNHPVTRAEVEIERAIMKKLEGGCSLPLGVYCKKNKSSQNYKVHAFLGINSETHIWKKFLYFESEAKEPEIIGHVVDHFLEKKKQDG